MVSTINFEDGEDHNSDIQHDLYFDPWITTEEGLPLHYLEVPSALEG